MKKYLVSVYIWTFGVLLFAAILATAVFWSYLFSREKYNPWFQSLLRAFFKLIFVRVECQGSEHIDRGRAYLFMSNHVSLFDLPLLAAYVPVSFRGVSAREQFDWPGYGWFQRRYGNIPIDRGSVHSSIASIRQAADVLRNGESITILPEGSRSLDGKLGDFKKLPFHLAKEAKADIVPVGLSGLYDLKNKGSWLIRPGKVKIAFGEIVPAAEVAALSALELRDRLYREIGKLIDGRQLQKNGDREGKNVE